MKPKTKRHRPPAIPPAQIMPRPCLTEGATLLLEALVRGKRVFEFGSGGSTLWLATRAAVLESVEDNPEWYEAVTRDLETLDARQVLVHLRATADLHHAIDGRGEFDVVFVDCLAQAARQQAIIQGAPHVVPGGWLVADDYDFPLTNAEVEHLRGAGWDVAVVRGVKLHPIKGIFVNTATAFCHRPAARRALRMPQRKER